ncbi:MAG: ABC transporter ATP-binding protein [Oscillospiraceae bacterium]|nr:ABC transporter ATP-binding protein [Oscillospiraceae bacterium]
MNAIEIKGLEKRYDGFQLGSFDLTLPSGCIMGLVGENGAGKSTTIKLIMNAIGRDAGEISVLGVDNRSAEFRDVKEDIGVVLDEAYFPEVMSARNVGKVMALTYKNWDAAAFEGYLKKFSLAPDKIFKDYSRGMRMKLAIAAALSHGAKLLILDEATSGLDPMARDELLDIFNDFTRDENCSILLSSHIVSDLEKICDYIAFLHRGRLVLCEEKDRLLEEYALVRTPEERLRELPEESVISRRASGYGTEALVLRGGIPAAIPTEHTSLEDIILFLAKGDERK